MKKLFVIFTVLLLLVFFNSTGYSQDKPLKFGARLGTNLVFTNADISGLDIEPRFTLNIGGFMEYWTSKKFGIQGGLLYNQKGAQWGESIGGESVDLIWKFNYLSIPIYGKVAFGDRTRLYLIFGPEFSFLLSANQEIKSTITLPSGTNEEEEKA